MDLIGCYNNVLSNDICNELINIFDKDKNKKIINSDVKKTLELHLSCSSFKDELIKYDLILSKILNKYINIYLKIFIKTSFNIYKKFEDKGFEIHKYEKNIGFYKYHCDDEYNFEEKNIKLITYIFYLNTIDEDGETEFFGNYKIKPEQGKLILFPSDWCFPYSDLISINTNKYIITGWFYGYTY